MTKYRSGLIINVDPTRNDLRELNCLSRQIETSSSEEITSTISIELKNSNVSILSLMIDAAGNHQLEITQLNKYNLHKLLFLFNLTRISICL